MNKETCGGKEQTGALNMVQSGKDGDGEWLTGSTGRGSGMPDASLSHMAARFLTRGQTPSSDSPASMNFGRKSEGHWLCTPTQVKG